MTMDKARIARAEPEFSQAMELPVEKCSCGLYPRFDAVAEPDGLLSWFACPPAPRGCGRAGPTVAGEAPMRAAAADAWDRMRKRERRG